PGCAVGGRVAPARAGGALLAAADRIAPDAWRPLLMSFRALFARGPRVETSRLAAGPESAYAPWKRGPLLRLASRALGAVAQYRYGVEEEGNEDGRSH